jgi:hypothetical protein
MWADEQSTLIWRKFRNCRKAWNLNTRAISIKFDSYNFEICSKFVEFNYLIAHFGANGTLLCGPAEQAAAVRHALRHAVHLARLILSPADYLVDTLKTITSETIRNRKLNLK